MGYGNYSIEIISNGWNRNRNISECLEWSHELDNIVLVVLLQLLKIREIKYKMFYKYMTLSSRIKIYAFLTSFSIYLIS